MKKIIYSLLFLGLLPACKDNTSPDMDGGSLQKYILLVPEKTGTTRFKLYSFLEQPPTAEDSTRFTEYSLEIQN